MNSMENAQLFTFTLEVLPEDANDADPALVSALGRDVTDIFRAQGETVEPVYAGERGGAFLAQVATLLITAWGNKDIILSDMSALVSILTPLVLTTRSLRHAYEQRVGKPLAQQNPLAITIEVHGITMKVEVTDQKGAVDLATELAQRFQAQQAAGQVPILTASTNAKIRAEVPKRPTRKRR
jgi:hypothetical protein